MPLLQLSKLMSAVLDPCSIAPAITSVTLDSEVLDTCANDGWTVTWDCNLGDTLETGLEIYWEDKMNRGAWSFWGRGTSTSKVYQDPEVGSDDQGNGRNAAAKYHQARCSIVPTGESPPNNCDAGSNEPVEGPEESLAANGGWNCFA